jgi:hypothetical protein
MTMLAVKWIYVLDQDYVWNVGRHLSGQIPEEGCAFEDRNGRRWLEIAANGDATVKAGYAWDGCTPKFALWDIVFGVPDGVPNELTKKPKAYYASLLHDALYQFLDAGLPMKRRGADQVFLELLERDRFGPRWVYYGTVRALGGLFRRFTRWKRAYHGCRVTR